MTRGKTRGIKEGKYIQVYRYKILFNLKLYKLNKIQLTLCLTLDIIYYRDTPNTHPFDRKRGL